MAPGTLITIPLSHYCEKARWGLDRAAVPYREDPHAPLLSRLATKRDERGTVPVLVQGNRRLADSTDILVHADEVNGGNPLYPRDAVLRSEVDNLVKWFDAELGPHCRRWVYAQLLPDAKLLRSIWSRRVPRFEAVLVPVITPLARHLVRRVYKITPTSAQSSLARVTGVFRQVSDTLSDGRRFLVGGRFTAADLTYAALAAPVLFPAECRAVLPGLDAVPAAMREEILRLRSTDAGQFAMRLYAQEREASPS
jgi:glutathione S-transferase